LQEDAAGKKLFAQTTTEIKIVCLEKNFHPLPPLQKNKGPSLRGRLPEPGWLGRRAGSVCRDS